MLWRRLTVLANDRTADKTLRYLLLLSLHWLALASLVKVLSSAPIVGHVQGIFNGRWPLPLGVSH